jgi:hypothetical protein
MGRAAWRGRLLLPENWPGNATCERKPGTRWKGLCGTGRVRGRGFDRGWECPYDEQVGCPAQQGAAAQPRRSEGEADIRTWCPLVQWQDS